jgi:cellulose synthase/poly-beta-1,6-N-acetylglucosamine synthase-like glycosyltransferase
VRKAYDALGIVRAANECDARTTLGWIDERKSLSCAHADPSDRWTVPTFSILIPAYEAASTVGGSGVGAGQTVPAEVIVCDDGSTDDLAGALAPCLDRIRLLRKPNGGGAAALNHAARSTATSADASIARPVRN